MLIVKLFWRTAHKLCIGHRLHFVKVPVYFASTCATVLLFFLEIEGHGRRKNFHIDLAAL